MRTNRKRVAVPFLFRAADGLGANGKLIARAYGNEVEGVFTRADQSRVTDTNGVLAVMPHSVPLLGVTDSEAVLTLAGATTNYLLRAQEFDNASWNKTNVTVTANQTTAPDGTLTADKVAATATAATQMDQTETTITATEVTYSIYGKIGSGATDMNRFTLRNATTATNLVEVTINWTTGVVTNTTGTGRSEAIGNGWWRVMLTATSGITSGDNITVYAGSTGSSETAGEFCYLWGAQLEALPRATPYVPTTTVAVARAADALYFPFTTTPQALTLYVRGFERGGAYVGAASYIATIGSATGAVQSVYITVAAVATGSIYGGINTTAGGSSAIVSGTPALGDTVEWRLTVSSAGATQLHQSINGATETSSSIVTRALDATWNASRLNLASGGAAHRDYTHVCVALGSKTLDEMRALAEVA